MSRTVCGICWCPYDEETGACACEPESKAQHMTTLRTAAQQALEALEDIGKKNLWWGKVDEAITALRAALAEPVPEPVAWKDKIYESLYHQNFGNSIPLYTTPPHRKPLTEEAAWELVEQDHRMEEYGETALELIRKVERAHGIT